MNLCQTIIQIPSSPPDYGTPDSEQKCYVENIKSIQKMGCLLITHLLSNMFFNKSFLVTAGPVFGGGIQSVVVSAVLITLWVPHSELILQLLMVLIFRFRGYSQLIHTHYGPWSGTKPVAPHPSVALDYGKSKPTSKLWSLLLTLQHWTFGHSYQGIIVWPVVKLPEIVLGPTGSSTGVQSRVLKLLKQRMTQILWYLELNELIAMHSGDPNTAIITIINATFNLQEKAIH